MKTFIRRLSSRGEDPSAAEARQAPHGGGVALSGRGSSPGLGAPLSHGLGVPKPVDFAAAWGRLHAALELLTAEGRPAAAASASWLALYTDVYRVCTAPAPSPQLQRGGEGGAPRRLYDHLHGFLGGHCEGVVASLQAHAQSEACTAFQFLALYARLFSNYTQGMETGEKLLSYLDRFWITKHHQKRGMEPVPGVMAMAELVPLIWRQRVLRPEVGALLQRAFNAVVADLREDPAGPGPEHLQVLRDVVDSFLRLGRTLEPGNPAGFYKAQLEDHLLKQVYLHYAGQANAFAQKVARGLHQLDEAAVAGYIRHVQRCIRAEEAIWASVHPGTSRGAVRVVRKSMLESEPHHRILGAFASAALSFRQERLADLELLYRLLDNEDVDPAKGIEALRGIFLGYVKELGAREVKRANEEARLRKASPQRPHLSHMLLAGRAALPADYVSSEAIQTMLDLYSHYLNLVRVTFLEDTRFSKAFKTACEHFINHLPNMPESLAIHAHYFLDRTCPESRTENIDVALDSIILLFNFVQDKDLFHRTYARLLASRIIHEASVSDEAERRMMKHLMQVCGFQYAMTFQRMFMDKTLSKELALEFRQWELREREQQRMEVAGAEEGGGGGGGAGERPAGGHGHGRRKSDSAIEFVETESGHVTPKSVSPKLSQGMRFIGLHDASPLQMLLAKRVFADKGKKYSRSSTAAEAGAMGGGGGGGGVAMAGGAGGGVGAAGPASARAVGTFQRAHTFFFGDDDLESPGGFAAAGGGGGGPLSALDKQHLAATGAGAAAEVDFFAFVLTGGSWPYSQAQAAAGGGGLPRVRLPPQLQRCVEGFAAFYDAKYKRRRLAWLHELGHGEVLFRCPALGSSSDSARSGLGDPVLLDGSGSGSASLQGGGLEREYTLSVSTHQMALLLLFNARGEWTLEGLAAKLDLDFGELVLCLYPLVKTQVLAVAPPVALASQLTRQHAVAVNLELARRGRHLAVPRKCDEAELPTSALLDSPRSMDPGRISPTLLNERKSAVEARVVHLMKKAGSMRHDQLVEGVLAHTRRMNFVPPVEFVCEVIRGDIEKDFIELAEDGPNPLYRYQA